MPVVTNVSDAAGIWNRNPDENFTRLVNQARQEAKEEMEEIIKRNEIDRDSNQTLIHQDLHQMNSTD